MSAAACPTSLSSGVAQGALRPRGTQHSSVLPPGLRVAPLMLLFCRFFSLVPG